jgi:hypothetical protein
MKALIHAGLNRRAPIPARRAISYQSLPAPLRGGTETNAPVQPPAPPPARPPAGNTGKRGLRLYPVPSVTSDWLRLKDRDLVPGRFLGWEADAVRWEVAGAPRPVRFSLSGVDRLVWAGPVRAAQGADRWVVRLTNGSVLPAEEVRLEEKTVVATATAAGTLRLPVGMVTALYRNPYPAGKGRILHNVEDWEVVGATGAGGGVADDFQGSCRTSYAEVLPSEPVLLEFDWPPTDEGGYIQMRLPLQSFENDGNQVHVFLDINNPYHKNTLLFTRQGVGNWGGAEVSVARPRGARPRVGVALHAGSGCAVVYVDGKLAGRQHVNFWAESMMAGVPLPGVLLRTRGNRWPVRPLLITPINDDLTLPVATAGQDVIRLANTEAMVGTLTGLTATNFSFIGSLGALELPVERFVGVVFAAAGRTEPRRRENDVQLQFHDGGQLAAELKEVSADQLVVESDAFGRATVPRAGVHRLQRGLDRPSPPAASPKQVARGTVMPREQQPDVIGLPGGNLLNGKLQGVTPQTVTWQHPHTLDPLEFAVTNVLFANLPAAGAPTNPPLPARVRFANGDQLRGDLLGVDAQVVHLRPLHTAPVRIPSRHVAELRPGASAEGVLDAGPIEKWDKPRKPALTSPLVYSRKLPLPPRVRLQFEIEPRWAPDKLSVEVKSYYKVYTSELYSGPLDYNLTLVSNGVFSSQYFLNSDGTFCDDESLATGYSAPGLGQRPVSEITWLLDTVKGEAFVLLDGKQIRHIRNLRKTDLGQEIRFEIGYPHIAQLRSVLVTEWKGDADFMAPSKGDAVRLNDYSLLASPVESVRDGMLYRAGQAPVSLANVFSVSFNPTEVERARSTAQDVRVTLWDGDELTLANLQVTGRGVTGTSEAFGEITIPSNAIRQLNFRPHDPPPTTNPSDAQPRFLGEAF